ncbi:MAG: DNA repair protein RecO [Pseudobutyrivibrio sp.]|nr:DNA repair protein RecO [Pseudobutyrivibrio sp.]
MALCTLTGLVLASSNVGEFDKRLVILTRERGKVTAFAKSCRRPNNPLIAATSPFCFGTFEAYEGRNSYHISKAEISNYFRDLTLDYDKVCIGSYFLEMAEYKAMEGVDERQRLALLYQSLKAIESGRFSLTLLRDIYELKSYVIDGEYPEVFRCVKCGEKEAKKLNTFSQRLHGCLCDRCVATEGGTDISQTVLYAMQFIISMPIEKLYTFVLNDETEKALTQLLGNYRSNNHNHIYKSEVFL